MKPGNGSAGEENVPLIVDGPDIPVEVLRAHEEGRLVFFMRIRRPLIRGPKIIGRFESLKGSSRFRVERNRAREGR